MQLIEHPVAQFTVNFIGDVGVEANQLPISNRVTKPNVVVSFARHLIKHLAHPTPVIVIPRNEQGSIVPISQKVLGQLVSGDRVFVTEVA